METNEPASTLSSSTHQEELERLNRLYAMLSHINRAIIRIEDAQELYLAACRIATESVGFALAWIALIEPSTGRAVPQAASGAADVTRIMEITRGAGTPTPTEIAVGSERVVIVNDPGNEQQMAAWQAIAEHTGIRSGGSFPIRLEGSIIGAFNVGASEAGFFRDPEIKLLLEVADDLSFALEVIRREERRLAGETKIRYLAYYDAQTGMPTRALFEERLAAACAEEPDGQVVVMVANLRNYHGIVQLLGPVAGQEIIRTAAMRIETVLPVVPIARVSETMFAAMLRSPAGLDVVEEQSWLLHRALSAAGQASGREVFLDPFIGIAVSPKDGDAAGIVLEHAIQAAEVATQDSNGHCRFFFSELDDGSRRRLELDSALRRALERNEFRLYYQPQVDLATGRIVGAEALLRWQHPEHGLVSPGEFVPLLEDNGLIGAVGEWVLQEACRQGKYWQDKGLQPIRIAVNLSARQFYNNDIHAVVMRALATSGLEAQWLELELTEGVVLLNADGVIRMMKELNAIGVSHALDDFGTGYSSLSYLQRLPVARIKIDRSFVTNITSNPSNAAIARAVVGMAHSLGMSVIAEGVETEGQLGFLYGLGCEEIQGFLFSPPLPPDEFATLLRDGRCIAPRLSCKTEQVLLVVDDEPNMLTALQRLLRRHPYRVVTTTSAREGFDLLASHNPGVVICDQRMPEMTGTEFLRRVKQLYPDTVRIVLSGYTELNSIIDAVNQGAIYKFITKPWDDEALCQSIDDAFRIHDLQRENRELTSMLRARSQ